MRPLAHLVALSLFSSSSSSSSSVTDFALSRTDRSTRTPPSPGLPSPPPLVPLYQQTLHSVAFYKPVSRSSTACPLISSARSSPSTSNSLLVQSPVHFLSLSLSGTVCDESESTKHGTAKKLAHDPTSAARRKGKSAPTRPRTALMPHIHQARGSSARRRRCERSRGVSEGRRERERERERGAHAWASRGACASLAPRRPSSRRLLRPCTCS